MNRISSFIIKKLYMEGFKRFTEPVEFDFGNLTYITGHNSQGKSSIADAITFAITGAPYFGAERNLDRLYSIGTKDIKVALTIAVDGIEHELIRERTNDTTTVTYDGVLANQTDLIELFGERDLFLSIINPLYFIEELGEKGRNLLARYLPTVAHEDVMTRLTEPNRKLIEESKMVSPEGMLIRLKDDIKEIKDTIIRFEGQRDLLASQMLGRDERLKAMKAQADELEIQMSELWNKRIKGLDFVALESQRTDLYKKLDEISRSSDVSTATKMEVEILRLKQAIESRQKDEYKSKYAQAMSEAQVRLEQKINSFYQMKEAYSAISPGNPCPTCKQCISKTAALEAKAAIAQVGTKISNEGKGLTEQLKELQELDKKALDVFERFKATDIAEMENLLKKTEFDRKSNAAEGVEVDRTTKMAGIKAQILSLDITIENGNLTDSEMKRHNDLLKKYENLCTQIDALESECRIAPVDKEQEIERLQETLDRKKLLETAVKFYVAERMAIQFESFDMLQKVNIQLYEIVKTTGEVKDVFKFTYEDRPYKYLSYSEKIKAGLELSELLKKLTKTNYPVFIDNGESVPVIDNIRPTGQVIISQVVKGATLKVSIIDTSIQQVAA